MAATKVTDWSHGMWKGEVRRAEEPTTRPVRRSSRRRFSVIDPSVALCRDGDGVVQGWGLFEHGALRAATPIGVRRLNRAGA